MIGTLSGFVMILLKFGSFQANRKNARPTADALKNTIGRVRNFRQIRAEARSAVVRIVYGIGAAR